MDGPMRIETREDDDAARHGGKSSNNPDLMSFHEGEFENVENREIPTSRTDEKEDR
jgi:hypothetical protein